MTWKLSSDRYHWYLSDIYLKSIKQDFNIEILKSCAGCNFSLAMLHCVLLHCRLSIHGMFYKVYFRFPVNEPNFPCFLFRSTCLGVKWLWSFKMPGGQKWSEIMNRLLWVQRISKFQLMQTTNAISGFFPYGRDKTPPEIFAKVFIYFFWHVIWRIFFVILVKYL